MIFSPPKDIVEYASPSKTHNFRRYVGLLSGSLHVAEATWPCAYLLFDYECIVNRRLL